MILGYDPDQVPVESSVDERWTAALSSSTYFCRSPGTKLVRPVTLPPGRANLVADRIRDDYIHVLPHQPVREARETLRLCRGSYASQDEVSSFDVAQFITERFPPIRLARVQRPHAQS